ncbi:MAG: sulfite exporter TauE/SafE family protein [Sulfurifustis sp.]
MEWAYSFSGLVVGFLVGLTGMGAAALMTPLLVLFFGIAPATAVGTDLLYSSITKAGGAWVHGRRGQVNLHIVGWLAGGSVPAAFATAWVLNTFHAKGASFSSVVNPVLGIALILTASALLFRETLRRTARHRTKSDRIELPAYLIPLTIATGAALGVLVTLSSVGAGTLGIAVLFSLYPRLPTAKIVGTDIAHAVPLTGIAGLGYLFMGNIDFALLGYLLLGSLPGIYLGSHLSGRFPEQMLRPVIACLLAGMGGRLIW